MSTASTLTPAELVAIADRHARTTEGEWYLARGPARGQLSISIRSDDPFGGFTVLFTAEWGTDADIAFVAQAHQDVPRLIADIKDARAAIVRIGNERSALTDEVEALQAAASRRDAEIASVRVEYDTLVQGLGQRILELTAALSEQETALVRQATEHKEQARALAGEIDALREVIAARDASAAATSDEYDRRVMDFLTEVEQLNARVGRQQMRLAERDNLIAEMLFRHQPIFFCDICGQHGAPELEHAPDCLIARATRLVGRHSRMRLIESFSGPNVARDGTLLSESLGEGLDIGETLP